MKYASQCFSRDLLRLVSIWFALSSATNAIAYQEDATLNPPKHSFSSQQCNTDSIVKQQQGYYQEYFQKSFYPASQLKGIKIQHKLPMLDFKVEKMVPHLTNISTQGMVIENGYVYESSGSLGGSKIVRYSYADLVTRSIINRKSSIELPQNIFAEGLVAANDRLYVAMLKKEKILVLDPETLKTIREIRIKGDVWGMTYYKDKLIISRGDSIVDTIDPLTGTVVKSSIVNSLDFPLYGINEMEVVGKFIYANVWPTDCLAVINPRNFSVIAWINIAPLFPKLERQHWAQVANGIAFDPVASRLLVTGKHWNNAFYLNVSTPVELKSK